MLGTLFLGVYPLMGEGVVGAGEEGVGEVLADLRPRLFGNEAVDHVGEHCLCMIKRGRFELGGCHGCEVIDVNYVRDVRDVADVRDFRLLVFG